MKKLIAILLPVMLISLMVLIHSTPTVGKVPYRYEPLDESVFRPVVPTTTIVPIIVDTFPRTLPKKRSVAPIATAEVKVEIKPTNSPTNRLKGKASWYCNYDNSKFDWSICHYKYPDNAGPDYYAAACGKLRRAIGPKWRNDIVTVKNIENNKTVRVKLVDWCGSKTKTIDLYQDAMGKIGAKWTAQVEITWK